MALHRLPCLLHRNGVTLLCRSFCDHRACVSRIEASVGGATAQVLIGDVGGYKERFHVKNTHGIHTCIASYSQHLVSLLWYFLLLLSGSNVYCLHRRPGDYRVIICCTWYVVCFSWCPLPFVLCVAFGFPSLFLACLVLGHFVLLTHDQIGNG